MIFNSFLSFINILLIYPLIIEWILDLTINLKASPLGLSLSQLTWLVTQVVALTSIHKNAAAGLAWFMLIISIETIHLLVFISVNLLNFFILYETALLPLILIINRTGSGSNRLRSGYIFLIFTLGSSLPIMFVILYSLQIIGTGMGIEGSWGVAVSFHIHPTGITVLWIICALSFGVKTPLYPFTLWLTAAHTEAPVEASILLAGVVLKLASFGITAVLINLFWEGGIIIMPYSFCICLVTLIISSLALLQQVDLKSFVALSSVAHISIGTLGLLIFYEEGLIGGWILALAHGIISPCLFLLIGGFVYQTFHTRLTYPLRGLTNTLPSVSTFLLLALLANLGFPPFANWLAELLLLTSFTRKLKFITFISATSVVLGTLYTFWWFCQISQGEWGPYLRSNRDLGLVDTISSIYLIFITLALGTKGLGFTETLIVTAWASLIRIKFVGSFKYYYSHFS